jgi:ABC-type Fe3+/spermidine/putrescine transport system ATPase subunit
LAKLCALPHLNCKNIEFGLTLRRYNRKAVNAKVEQVADLSISAASRDARRAERRTKQRVAIARALATDPNILPLDEPECAGCAFAHSGTG